MNTSSKVERTFRYGPYGENIKSEGTQTIPYPFGYKGGYRMPGGNTGKGNVANGLIPLRRNATTTPPPDAGPNKTHEDHVGSATQGDRFLFAGDDPLNLNDPSGLSAVGDYGRACAEGIVVTLPGNTETPGAAAVAGCAGGVVVQGGVEVAEELGI